MNNPRLANRYAKSLLDLAVERDVLSPVIEDMKMFVRLCRQNPDFVTVLSSPIIASDKKLKIIESITADRVHELTTLFIRLLVQKTREINLPGIAKAFVEQYNVLKNIYKVKFTTAHPVSEELQKTIAAKVKAEKNLENIEWESAVDESLIGGFKLQLGDLLIDASVSHDLKDISRQFLNNDYIHKLR